MKASAIKYSILSFVTTLVIVILALMPFHAFLTVWLASVADHYTALRLWKELVLLICVGGVAYLFATDVKIRTHTLPRRLTQLVILYVLLLMIWGLVALQQHGVSAKALGYGVLIDARFLVFFLVCWSVTLRTSRLSSQWQKIVLIPTAIVVAFGLLQMFVLPHDFLRHFGYGLQTIPAFETINHNAHYVRIESTLRGANPLGAYLIVPISLLVAMLARGKRSWQLIALLVGSVVVLIGSFSRSAWIGALLSVIIVIAVAGLRSPRVRQAVKFVVPIAVALLLLAVLTLKNNPRFENVFLHTEHHSAIASTSNDGHVSALKQGLREVVDHPLGSGPGTSGPASVYNTKPARIPENYFIQIGEETGWLGLLLFLMINAGVGYLLWLRRRDTLALGLFASLIGLSFVNLLSHAWADDTLAYVWWGLAGIAMAAAPLISDDRLPLPGRKSKKPSNA